MRGHIQQSGETGCRVKAYIGRDARVVCCNVKWTVRGSQRYAYEGVLSSG